MCCSEFLRKKLDNLQQVRNSLIQETNSLEERINAIQKKHSTTVMDLQYLTERKKEILQELANISKARRTAESDLSELKLRIEHLTEVINGKDSEIATMDKQLKEGEMDKAKKKKEVEQLIREEMKRSDLRDQEVRNLKEHIAENAKLESYIESVIMSKSKIDESINSVKQAKDKSQKTIDKLNKRKRRREMVANDMKLKQERTGREIAEFKESIKELEEQFEREKAYVEKAKKEKKILDKSIRMAWRDIERLASELLVRRGHLRNVETLLKGYSKSAQNRRNDQYRLEQERDQYEIACAEAERRLEDAKEALIAKKQETEDLKDKITNGQERLKQQQALLDQVTQERNTYTKNLIDAQKEIETMKREWERMIDQIHKYKNDIKQKEVEKIETTVDLAKLLDKNQKLKDHEKVQKERIKELDGENRKLEKQISKLNAIIREADLEVNKQQKEFEAVVNDRDILGAQLIKRNDELAQLYEKIKSQQSLVAKAGVQYEQKMRDIEVVTNRINELTQNKAKLEYKTRDLEELQAEVNLLQKTLIGEKQKLRSLEDEENTPLNVHPWRRIEGSDPWSYSMFAKIQDLQKQLIDKTEQVLQKDLLIQQKEKLYLELRKMIARMPGVEANVQWEKYRKSLNGKQEQYETLKGQVRDTRIKIRQLKDTRQDLLMKWEDIGARYSTSMNLANKM